MGLADDDHAGADQPLCERSGHRRDSVCPELAASGRDAAFDVDEILERYG